MNRLLHELDRLYGLGPESFRNAAARPQGAGSQEGLRAAVLAVLLPAGWDQLAPAWRGVQSDLALPAPAIAVSGVDALQLWFSFATPMLPSARVRFLQCLCDRYLPGVKASHIRMFAEAAGLPPAPCRETGPQRWSAFIAHDLASVFDGTPWLDIPPTDEGQANLLRALEPIAPTAFEAALNTLGAIDTVTTREPVAAGRLGPVEGAAQWESDPARFLTSVMNDATAPLALRVEAARSLLRCSRTG